VDEAQISNVSHTQGQNNDQAAEDLESKLQIVTIFGNFCQFSAKIVIFLNTNFIILFVA
jgi:hypothetical protein